MTEQGTSIHIYMKFIGSQVQWLRRLLRRPRHDDGLTDHNRSGLQLHQEYDYLREATQVQ